MSEGKSAGFFPSFLSGLYADWFGRGMGLGGGGHGSVPSAISTLVLLNPQAAALQFGCFAPRACTTWEKTATAASKTNVTRVPRTLSFNIFISLKKLARIGACRYEHPSRPRAKGRREVSRLELCEISGQDPDQKSNARHVSECVIARGRGNRRAGGLRPARLLPRTFTTRHTESSFPY